ncbi:MAG: hypothetical protein JNK82_30130, partial [Myxococcaceae bacterium]|nr:hypothetical protein [Myxococcaceae bacterium]
KSGFAMFRGSADLNGAVTRDCSDRARKLLDGDCAALDEAAAYAVPGDGIQANIDERRVGLRCKHRVR